MKQTPLLCFPAILSAVFWSSTVPPSCKITFALTRPSLWKKMNEPLRLPCQHISIKAASPARRLAGRPFKGGPFSSDWTERPVNHNAPSWDRARARLCPRVLSVAREREREREREGEREREREGERERERERGRGRQYCRTFKQQENTHNCSI